MLRCVSFCFSSSPNLSQRKDCSLQNARIAARASLHDSGMQAWSRPSALLPPLSRPADSAAASRRIIITASPLLILHSVAIDKNAVRVSLAVQRLAPGGTAQIGLRCILIPRCRVLIVAYERNSLRGYPTSHTRLVYTAEEDRGRISRSA